MKEIVICAIAKYENNYIKEWVDYHLNLGFSKIYIYDNNDLDGEKISDVIDVENYSNAIIIVNIRGQKQMQKKIYDAFYKNYSFDWCAFIDLDEFITFNSKSGFTNIGSYLETVKDFECVHINWLCYGDNKQVNYQEKSMVIERFPNPIMPIDFKLSHNFPENNHIKSILQKGLSINWITNPHTPDGDIKICDENGILHPNSLFKSYSHNVIYIRHYFTKSIEEYCLRVVRQCADSKYYAYNFSKFYTINNFTINKFYQQKRLQKKYKIPFKIKNSFLACLYVYFKSLLSDKKID